jgi:hypothetical protein
MEKRYVVPGGMLKAAYEGLNKSIRMDRGSNLGGCEILLEAAMGWLDGELSNLVPIARLSKKEDFGFRVAIGQIRHVYLAQEPESQLSPAQELANLE